LNRLEDALELSHDPGNVDVSLGAVLETEVEVEALERANGDDVGTRLGEIPR
jgi:hypothetical protein